MYVRSRFIVDFRECQRTTGIITRDPNVRLETGGGVCRILKNT